MSEKATREVWLNLTNGRNKKVKKVSPLLEVERNSAHWHKGHSKIWVQGKSWWEKKRRGGVLLFFLGVCVFGVFCFVGCCFLGVGDGFGFFVFGVGGNWDFGCFFLVGLVLGILCGCVVFGWFEEPGML